MNRIIQEGSTREQIASATKAYLDSGLIVHKWQGPLWAPLRQVSPSRGYAVETDNEPEVRNPSRTVLNFTIPTPQGDVFANNMRNAVEIARCWGTDPDRIISKHKKSTDRWGLKGRTYQTLNHIAEHGPCYTMDIPSNNRGQTNVVLSVAQNDGRVAGNGEKPTKWEITKTGREYLADVQARESK